LYNEMPYFVDGLMLLGVTLSEKRDDVEAMVIFERVEKILRLRSLKEAERKVLYHAKLFHAISQRKLYTWQSNHQAIEELNELQEEIEEERKRLGKEIKGDPSRVDELASDLSDYAKIYVSTLIEEAYAHAVEIVLLNRQNFIEALTTD